MAIIPTSVFDKYAEFADAMIDELGIDCYLVYPEIINTTNYNVPPIKQKKTMFIGDTHDDFKRSDQSFVGENVKEVVKMRVYWDQKSYRKIADINIPEGGIVCISKFDTLSKIKKASYIVIYKTSSNSSDEYLFEKISEPQVFGLNKNYIMSFWERVC